MTNLFLHAGAGEDTALFPQAGGDHLGHGGRVSCVLDLGGGADTNTHTEKYSRLRKHLRTQMNQSHRTTAPSGFSLFTFITQKNAVDEEERYFAKCRHGSSQKD